MAYEIILKGSVQGVCCRFYCGQVGRAMGLSGAATNLSSGNVQVLLATNDLSTAQKYADALRINKLGFRFYGSITGCEIRPWDGIIDGDYLW